MNTRAPLFYLLFCAAGLAGQQADTVTIQEVVVTAQISPQSIKKSLYKVEVITAEDLRRRAVTNAAEALSQMHNLLVVPEKNSGDSKANILGLRSDYTKILIDNIPVVGDTGLGSNIDLTKIGIDNIERIEVVKGSMGVEFGNNAMAGVINIITKKSSARRWSVRGFVQEESVGKEYDWVDYGKGRHIQNLAVSHTFGGGKWYTNLSLNRNDFQGYRGEKQGKNYFEQDNNRGYEWQPKEQWNPALILRYSAPKTQIFYKADYLTEEINYYSPLVNSKYLGGGERTFTGNDRDYFTDRMLHHLNISARFFRQTRYTGDFSYQKQSRKYQDILFDIPARARLSESEKSVYYQAKTLYARNTLSKFTGSEKLNLQIGHEIDYTKGFAGAVTAKYNDSHVEKDIINNAVFVSAEIPLTENWFARTGIRYNFSDTFKSKPNYSLVLKNQMGDRSEFRAIIGSANRNPTFEELFAYFVDSNHNIQGNADLQAENSFSGTLFYTFSDRKPGGGSWSLDVSTMYLQVKDRIEMAQVNATPLQFKYLNISSYQSWENAVSAKFSNRKFGVSAGYTLLGKMPQMDASADSRYFYNHEASFALWFSIEKTGTSFATNLKYSGNNYSFFEDRSLGITQYILGKRKDFTLMDASVTQKIWKEYLSVALGVRNIFDVTNVQNVSGSSGAHGTTAGQMLFYGRSYFARLNFTL